MASRTTKGLVDRSLAWLGNKKRQLTLKFIGSAIVVVISALWAAYVHFSGVPNRDMPTVSSAQKAVKGNGNIVSGVNTGTISVTVPLENQKNKEQK
jgi:hypothetical protein